MDVAGLYAGKIESWLNDVIPQMLKTLLPWTTCLISSVMGPRIPTSSQHWILIKCIYYLGRANSTLSLLEVYLSNSSQLWAEWSDYWRIMGKGFFYLTYFFIILTFCSSTFWASLVAQTVKNLPATQESWFDLWVGKIPWKREWLPTPVFLPGEFHGQRSLVGYNPWGRKESGHEWVTNTQKLKYENHIVKLHVEIRSSSLYSYRWVHRKHESVSRVFSCTMLIALNTCVWLSVTFTRLEQGQGWVLLLLALFLAKCLDQYLTHSGTQ